MDIVLVIKGEESFCIKVFWNNMIVKIEKNIVNLFFIVGDNNKGYVGIFFFFWKLIKDKNDNIVNNV